MNAVLHEVITSGSTNATNIVITDMATDSWSERSDRVPIRTAVFFLKVLSGTVKFGVNGIDADSKAWASTDTIPPITCGLGELYFKATGASDTFTIGG